LCHNKRSDAVALNGGGNEEELRDDAYDSNTSTIRLMLSQQELEGNGKISGVAEGRDTVVPLWLALTKCLTLVLGLMYSPFFGLGLAFSMTYPTLAWLLCAAGFMIFVFLHNLKCDKKIEHITGKEARSRDWFLKEALAHDVSEYVNSDPFPDEDYPLPYNLKEHSEPVGEEYQRYNEWEKIHKAIKALKNLYLEEEIDNDVQVGTPSITGADAEIDRTEIPDSMEIPNSMEFENYQFADSDNSVVSIHNCYAVASRKAVNRYGFRGRKMGQPARRNVKSFICLQHIKKLTTYMDKV
jgi:hypothetical protein